MKRLTLLTLGLLGFVVIGCNSQESSAPTGTQSTASDVDGRASNMDGSVSNVDASAFRLSEEPQGAKDVVDVREAAEEGEDVLVVGRIGGGANPWIDGRAAFTIVDGSLKACSDIPGDECEKPWDYCCETEKLPSSTALVKVVDEDGQLIKADARELLNVEELSTVVVKGKAQRDDAGNLTVLANGVYVRR